MNDEREAARRGRRAALTGIGAAGAALLVGQALGQAATDGGGTPACVLTPAQTEGPYFVDERLDRSDVRSDPKDGTVKAGALLHLQMRIASVDAGRCTPVAGAVVDIWHCDATGIYSDVDDMSFGTKGSRFLRGYQVTDTDGRVRFTTIYPGAYPGRAVHIHFKIRKGTREFTSQLYFDDALTDRVHAQPPYASRGARRTRNDGDGLYHRGGRQLQLDVAGTAEGYAASYDVGLRGA